MREIEPENFVLSYPTPKEPSVDAQIPNEGEIWFDWHFLDFWKSNYCKSFGNWYKTNWSMNSI